MRAFSYPWLAGLFFAVVFFLGSSQRLYITDDFRENSFSQRVDEIEQLVEEGDPYRRAAFMTWAIFVAAMLVRRSPFRLNLAGPAWWGCLAYVGYTALSLAWSDEPVMSAKRIFVFLINWAAAVAFIRRYGMEILPKMALVTCSIYLAVGLVSEIVMGSFEPWSVFYRFAGTAHPNQQGLNCAMLVLACAFARRHYPRYGRHFLAALLVVSVFLFLTKSRTGVACCLVAFVLQEMMLARRRTIFILLVGSAISLAALVVILFSSDRLQDMIMLGRAEETGGNLTGRIPLWESLLPFFYERPLLGYGFGAFWNTARLYLIADANGWGISQAHSAYVEHVLFGGIVGIGLFLLMMLMAVMQSWYRYVRHDEDCVIFGMAVIVFTALECFTESAIVWQIPLSFYLNISVIAAAAFFLPVKRPAGIRP